MALRALLAAGCATVALIGCGSSSSGHRGPADDESAQPDLAPERKQQVQDATTTFETQLTSIVRQTAAGLSKIDAKVASLKTAVEDFLQPIPC